MLDFVQEKDEKQAISWWRKAAEANHAKAQLKLGLAYADGKGVEKSPEQAFHWYTAIWRFIGLASDPLANSMVWPMCFEQARAIS